VVLLKTAVISCAFKQLLSWEFLNPLHSLFVLDHPSFETLDKLHEYFLNCFLLAEIMAIFFSVIKVCDWILVVRPAELANGMKMLEIIEQ
jgi:hypothetical protein